MIFLSLPTADLAIEEFSQHFFPDGKQLGFI
jgi:hypothetical protein